VIHPDETRWAIGGDCKIQGEAHLAIFSVETQTAEFVSDLVLPNQTVHSLDFSVNGLLGVLNRDSFRVRREEAGIWVCLWNSIGSRTSASHRHTPQAGPPVSCQKQWRRVMSFNSLLMGAFWLALSRA